MAQPTQSAHLSNSKVPLQAGICEGIKGGTPRQGRLRRAVSPVASSIPSTQKHTAAGAWLVPEGQWHHRHSGTTGGFGVQHNYAGSVKQLCSQANKIMGATIPFAGEDSVPVLMLVSCCSWTWTCTWLQSQSGCSSKVTSVPEYKPIRHYAAMQHLNNICAAVPKLMFRFWPKAKQGISYQQTAPTSLQPDQLVLLTYTATLHCKAAPTCTANLQ